MEFKGSSFDCKSTVVTFNNKVNGITRDKGQRVKYRDGSNKREKEKTKTGI